VSSAVKVVCALAAGGGLGVLSSVTNEWASLLTFVFNSGWAWAGIMVLGGWIGGTWRTAILTGVLAELAACTAYFATDSWLRGEPITSYLLELLYWSLISLALGPGLGLVGAVARGRGLGALLAGLVVPFGAALEMVWLPRWPLDSDNTELFVVRIMVWVAAAIGGGLFLIRYLLQRRSAGPIPEKESPSGGKRIAAILVIACTGIAGSLYIAEGGGLFRNSQYAWNLTEAQDTAEIIMRTTVNRTTPDVHEGKKVELVIVNVDGYIGTGTYLSDETVTVIVPRSAAEVIGFSEGEDYVLFLNVVDGEATLVDSQQGVFKVLDDGTISNAANLTLPDELLQSFDLAR